MSSAPRLVPTTVSTQVLSEFASDVVIGLSQPGQKELPSKYLYDEVGSALIRRDLRPSGIRLEPRRNADTEPPRGRHR